MDVKEQLLQKAFDLCSQNGDTLLYLTLFGSHLYGTNTETSDTDAKGIYLPNKRKLLLGRKIGTLDYSTGGSNDKNSAADVDVTLISIQDFLLKLLPIGETSATDILFSYSNKDCHIYLNNSYKDTLSDIFINNPFKYINPNNITAYSAYCIHQAHKYGIKGSRLGALKKAHTWIHNRFDNISSKDLHVLRIQDFIEDFLKECTDKNHCRYYQGDDEITSGIVILGKIFTNRTPLKLFITHLDRELEKFGKRAEAAMNNDGVDWKAISHALRALEQMRELLIDGKIIFPLVNRDYLIKVKKGLFNYSDIEDEIVSKLEYVQELQKEKKITKCYSMDYLEKCILSMYYNNNS